MVFYKFVLQHMTFCQMAFRQMKFQPISFQQRAFHQRTFQQKTFHQMALNQKEKNGKTNNQQANSMEFDNNVNSLNDTSNDCYVTFSQIPSYQTPVLTTIAYYEVSFNQIISL